MSIHEDVGELELSYTAGENVKFHCFLEKWFDSEG